MKQSLQRGLCLILLLVSLSACTTSDVVPLLAGDDCGPKPESPGEIVAVWFNKHYRYTPPNPARGDEFSFAEPTRVATNDVMLGRAVGWQVILGPENKFVTNFTELNYTRLIINRGRIVSVTSSDQRFLLVPKVPKK
jgi:hypothetical protein